jgi:hypothetical protein
VALPELSRRELKDSARFDLRRGLPGGEEVGEEGRATGGDGLGEGEEEVQQDPHPPASFEVNQAGLPRDLDPDGRLPCLGPSPRRLRPG